MTSRTLEQVLEYALMNEAFAEEATTWTRHNSPSPLASTIAFAFNHDLDDMMSIAGAMLDEDKC